jgi:hypothetical protein
MRARALNEFSPKVAKNQARNMREQTWMALGWKQGVSCVLVDMSTAVQVQRPATQSSDDSHSRRLHLITPIRIHLLPDYQE